MTGASVRWLSVLVPLLLAAGSWPSGATGPPAGSWHHGEVTAGDRTMAYHLWEPGAPLSGQAPLVVMLHGCTQDGLEIAETTAWNDLADQEGFFVLYPDQDPAYNSDRCWNWFRPEHQQRGAGEPLLIATATQGAIEQWPIDPERIYIAGASSGGGMAPILAATYPELYAGLGVAMGVEYRAASDLATAAYAQRFGGPDPDLAGRWAYEAAPAPEKMPTIVFHGGLDWVVAPVNGEQLVVQWAQTNDLVDDGVDNDSVDAAADAQRDGQVPGGHAYTVSCYHDAAGRPLLEHWGIPLMGHAWSGGPAGAPHTDPAGPDATRAMWDFWTGAAGGC
ncbi:MAG: alpha/beta hydrolase family esterase [Thermoplasmatota archaeon]